ncbi:hypothetical protein VKT23_000057 [Stygiomarasmius scandens]|uniref:Uncharacterized protein n=1 Tax=Marasmiellus scandens TaxID=2682957 RepID=A0ABR1K6I0_9AGAR
MLNGLCGWEWNFAHMRYSDYWRIHRKTFHQYFQPRFLSRFNPVQRKAVLELLDNLMISHDKHGSTIGFEGHLRNYAGSIILHVTYGIKTQQDCDYYVDLVERAIESIVHSGNFGDFLVDYLPLLKWVPSWFPGAAFKRKAKNWSKSVKELRDVPWKKLEVSIASDTAIPCFVTENLRNSYTDGGDQNKIQEVIKNCAGVSYLAAADTMSYT